MFTFKDTVFHQLYVISFFGDNMLFFLFVVLAFFIYLIYKNEIVTSVILILSLSSYVYSVFLKYIFKHSRPDTAFIEEMRHFDLYSFPSSHVLVYTVFWGFLLYISFKYVKKAKLFFHVLRWVCIYFVVFVGASRIALGMHHVKDVVAGYFFGLLYLGFLIYLDKKLNKVFSKDK